MANNSNTRPESPASLPLDKVVYRLEKALNGQGSQHPIDLIMAAIDDCHTFAAQRGLIERDVPEWLREHWYTRFAAAITAAVTRNDLRINLNQLEAVCRRKQTIAYIFHASGYRGTTHLIGQMGLTSDDGQTRVPNAVAAVLLAFLALDDVTDQLLDLALKQPPKVLFTLMMGWLTQRAVLTAQGEKNRGRLLTSGNLIERVEMEDRHIPLMVNTWMYSSYASHPQKHDIKFWLNGIMRRKMEKAISLEGSIKPWTLKSKPRMLVIHERFIKQHAMFRCYAPLIGQLKNEFNLVALSDTDMIDEASDAIFDEVHKLPSPRPPISTIAKLISGLKPDVVYYPSVGMSHWVVMVANLRLAPIQIASLGHPATTRMESIDYVYTPKMEGDLTKVFSEKILVGESGELFEPHADLMAEPPVLVAPSDREVRIAVNSKVMKLSHRLIDICKRLQGEASKPVTFSFFPGERGIYFDGLRPAIQSQLPTATVHPYQGYADFLKNIAKCDLALSAFPFGNTNSTVDTAILGLPTVAHFGPECPAQSDKRVMETAGLPLWTIADSDDAFFETALRLVEDEASRKEALGDLGREAIAANLLSNEANQEINHFGAVFIAACRHHDIIQANEKRVWTYTDLMALERQDQS